MTEKDKNSSNQSDWLNKIKEQENVSEDDQKQTMLDEDENEVEIEVEIKDKVEEKEEIAASEGETKDSEKEKETKEQAPEDKAPDENPEDKVKPEIKEEESKIRPCHEQPAAEEIISDVSAGLPKNFYAHFLLIDIDSSTREIRGLPRYMAINNARTLIGRYAKAHIHLDDPASVEIKHAKLIFEEKKGKRDFVIYQINNSNVSVNGRSLSGNGVALKSGDRVEIGSANLIFFHCDLERTA